MGCVNLLVWDDRIEPILESQLTTCNIKERQSVLLKGGYELNTFLLSILLRNTAKNKKPPIGTGGMNGKVRD